MALVVTQLFRNTTNDSSTATFRVEGTGNSLTDTSVTAGATYHYWLRSRVEYTQGDNHYSGFVYVGSVVIPSPNPAVTSGSWSFGFSTATYTYGVNGETESVRIRHRVNSAPWSSYTTVDVSPNGTGYQYNIGAFSGDLVEIEIIPYTGNNATGTVGGTHYDTTVVP